MRDAFEFAIVRDLSRLLLGTDVIAPSALEVIYELAEEKQQEFLAVAEFHRVLIRTLHALANRAGTSSQKLPEWVSLALDEEEHKAQQSVAMLASVCRKLTDNGFPAVVIKSLDHWPDLGSDFDIYTTGQADEIKKLMRESFHARAQTQSWSDRLAGKWRFQIPDMEQLLEIHLGGLGQTGQQAHMGRSTLRRRIHKTLGSDQFLIPSPEDQILIRAIDRCYRHYSLRICDIVDTVELIRSNSIDFDYLKNESKRAGIRKGVCAYLSIVDGYYSCYRDEHLFLPSWVRKAAAFSVDKIYAYGGLLRIPIFPQGARLFGHELTKAIRRKDVKKAVRTGLIPPLALAAGARFRIRGSDKGIW